MAPNWIPLCRSMQLYCEPFFASINNWRAYEDEALIHNRLECVETACQIFHMFSQNPELHKFELLCENEVPLLPEVPPTAGRDYKVGGDQIAFSAAMTTQPKVLFHKAGVFFQDNLLKGIAGWSPEVLAGANIETRATIINAVEKLFRLPEEAGLARFAFTQHSNSSSYVKRVQKDYPTVVLSHKGELFYRYIEASRKPGFDFDIDEKALNEGKMVVAVEKHAKNNNSKNKRKVEEDEWEADADGVMWTRKHHSVGSKVAAHFPPLEPQSHLVPTYHDASSAVGGNGSTSKLFRGTVTKYAPPSVAGLTDQLYHIRWEDGDEQDFDEIDIQRGMDLFDQIEGWTTRHTMVGIRVAAYFPVPKSKSGEVEQVLFSGTVTKFGRALSEDDVSLYHVEFDDGDEQDFSEHELQMGIELFNLEGLKDKKAKAAVAAAQAAAAATASSHITPAKNSASVASASTATSGSKSSSTNNNNSNKKAKVESTPSTTSAAASTSASKGKRSSIASVVEANPPSTSSAKKNSSSKSKASSPPKKGTSAKGASNKSKGKGKSLNIQLLEEVGEEEGNDDPIWTVNHESVLKRVAQAFALPPLKGQKTPRNELFGGTVAVYAAPSGPKEKDQLYHIVWDDGDEQDYDEADLQAGLLLLESQMPTPLYVASKEAKLLVQKRQRELACDYDYSSLNSSLNALSSSKTADQEGGSGDEESSGGDRKDNESVEVVEADENNDSSEVDSTHAASSSKHDNFTTTQVDQGSDDEVEVVENPTSTTKLNNECVMDLTEVDDNDNDNSVSNTTSFTTSIPSTAAEATTNPLHETLAHDEVSVEDSEDQDVQDAVHNSATPITTDIEYNAADATNTDTIMDHIPSYDSKNNDNSNNIGDNDGNNTASESDGVMSDDE